MKLAKSSIYYRKAPGFRGILFNVHSTQAATSGSKIRLAIVQHCGRRLHGGYDVRSDLSM